MAPEQIRGPRETVTARSDVYSFGVTLYELLSLRLPFEDADATVVRRAILLGAPRPLRSLNRAVPRDLETVCAKAMDRDPARRYVDAAALARDLRNVLERRPIDARPPSPALELYRLAQRHPIAATLLAALIVLPSALTWQARHHAGELQVALDAAQEERRKAEVEALTAGEVNAFLLQLFGSVDPSNARGREPTARELLEVGARKLETELVDQPLVRTRLLNSIGESFTSLGQWELALETLGRALALCAGTPAAESLEHADSLDALAMLELQLGRPGALEHASQAVELRRRIAPEPSLRLAEVLLGYALVLQEFGQLDQAESAYLETLDMVEALPGDQRPGRVAVLANLANLHQARGQYESALAEARAALDLQRSLDPSPHPAIGSALNVIALSLNGLGRHEEALSAFDELLDQERRLTGEDSTRYATFLAARSNAETALGHRAEALELLEQAAALFERSAPPEHLEALDCRRMLAETYQSAARWPEALDVYAELLPLIETVSAPGDGRGLALRARLALCHEALGAWPELEDILVEALERARLVDSADDDVSECVASAHLARALARRGDVDGAQSALARSLETSGQAALDTTPGAWAGLAAGVVAQAAGDLQRAVAELEPLADLERGRGSAAAVPAIARARLAAVLAASDPERSRRLAKRAQAELAGQLGPEHPETALLAALLESWR